MATDLEWLARIEDAGINASAPSEQRWIDGWLVRLAPGKARRARCIQPVAAGRSSIDDKLARSLPLYTEAGLQPFVRITPFAQPHGLDDHLARRGMAAIDETLVMTMRALADVDTAPDASGGREQVQIDAVDTGAFVDWISAARGSSLADRDGMHRRLARAPVPHHAFLLRDASGAAIAGGQVAIEEPFAGLYDIFTAPSARGRGHAERLCRHLLAHARRLGATAAYLQVEAANAAALRIYGRIGFSEGYRYHYRTPVMPTSR